MIWEAIAVDPHALSARLQVPGGWLYRTITRVPITGNAPSVVVQTFVPDPSAGVQMRTTECT